MRKFLIPLIICVLLLTGCTTSLSYTYDVTTGDKIEIELDTTDKYSMTTGSPFEITKDGVEQCKVTFVEAAKYDYYENAIASDSNATLLEKDSKDKHSYIFWNYNNEDDKEYNYIILVDDSNTAILLSSTISQETAEECFNRLTIILKSSKLTNGKENNKESDTDLDSGKESEENDTTQEDVSKEDETPSAGNTEVSSDWRNYTVSINEKSVTIPCTYEELSNATGAVMKSAESKSYLEGGYYTWLNLYNNDGDVVCHIEITNDSKEDKKYTDCAVTLIGQDSYNIEDNKNSVIIFPGNIVVGQASTEEELYKLFGEPTDVYRYQSEDSDYWSNTYTWAEDDTWTTYNCFEIELTNGIIDNVSLEHIEE